MVEFLVELVGLDVPPEELTLVQVSARAVVIYLAGFALLRIGQHRFLGKNTAFDIVLGFVFGAMLSRAINGSPLLVETIVAGALLMALHWALSFLSYRSQRVSRFIDGRAIPVVEDGKPIEENLRKHRINSDLLVENLRTSGKVERPEEVRTAHLERNGAISVIPRRSEPQIIEIAVEEGVQTVRIRLE